MVHIPRTEADSPTLPTIQWQPPGKRYRGGQTSQSGSRILPIRSVDKIPRDNSNDSEANVVGDKIYFLSDRNGRG